MVRYRDPNYQRNWYKQDRLKNPEKYKEINRKRSEEYHKNPDKFKSKANEYQRNWNFKIKVEVLSHYSKTDYPKCVDCGYDKIKALSIDHIEGGGTQHRRQIGGGGRFYWWLRKNGFPEGYDTVCMNCNWLRK